MGFIDKAKEAISHAADRLKDPDQDLVEKTWPLGQPDDEHVPSPAEEDSGPGAAPQPTQSAEGIDPDLDDSTEDQYREDDEER